MHFPIFPRLKLKCKLQVGYNYYVLCCPIIKSLLGSCMLAYVIPLPTACFLPFQVMQLVRHWMESSLPPKWVIPIFSSWLLRAMTVSFICLQGQEATPTAGEEAPPTHEKEEWAVKVDLNESVADFHQRIPNMAMKVRKSRIYKIRNSWARGYSNGPIRYK